ncbi:MAG: Abi family protein [Kocuria sp.]|nr:Abi family protein [Kocuria sp.]
MRISDILSTIETTFRFFIGHRLGRVNAFAHWCPQALSATREKDPSALPELTAAHCKWLKGYERQEKRAKDDFVGHFRRRYGTNLPIWVATEVMTFGLLSSLYALMPQSDQEILAARLQVLTADGHGDRGALGNWLNNLRNVRNICAHHGRLWNRAFDVTIEVPGWARKDADDLLAPLVDGGTSNRLYGVLLVMRHLLLSIDPEKGDVVDLADFIEDQSRAVGFGMAQLGFPDDWRNSPIWGRAFALDRSPMAAASLLDRAECMTAAETRASLTEAEVIESERTRTPAQAARAKKAAQRSLLRTYLKHDVVIEVELGETKFYPAFQFRDGKIVDALAEINQALARSCGGSDPTDVARALLDWWQTPHPRLAEDVAVSALSPLDLLNKVSERDFLSRICASGVLDDFVVPNPDFA